MTTFWTTRLDEFGADPTTPAAWIIHKASLAGQIAIGGLVATPEDLKDAEALASPSRRAARLERRLLLRVLAGRRLGVPAGDVRVERNEAGGLEITAPCRIYASVASRDAWSVVAICTNVIGVDVEAVCPPAQMPLALLHPSVAHGLASADSVTSAEAWTALEAFLKFTGAGLAGLSAVTLDQKAGVLSATDGTRTARISHQRLGAYVFACANPTARTVKATDGAVLSD